MTSVYVLLFLMYKTGYVPMGEYQSLAACRAYAGAMADQMRKDGEWGRNYGFVCVPSPPKQNS